MPRLTLLAFVCSLLLIQLVAAARLHTNSTSKSRSSLSKLQSAVDTLSSLQTNPAAPNGILHNVASALRLTSLGRRDIWYAIYENHSLTAAKLDSMLKRLPADKLRTLDEFTVGVNQQRVNAMTQATLYRNMKLARVLVQNGCSCHPTLELPFASAFTEAMSMGFGAKRAAKKAAKRSHQYTVIYSRRSQEAIALLGMSECDFGSEYFSKVYTKYQVTLLDVAVARCDINVARRLVELGASPTHVSGYDGSNTVGKAVHAIFHGSHEKMCDGEALLNALGTRNVVAAGFLHSNAAGITPKMQLLADQRELALHVKSIGDALTELQSTPVSQAKAAGNRRHQEELIKANESVTKLRDRIEGLLRKYTTLSSIDETR